VEGKAFPNCGPSASAETVPSKPAEQQPDGAAQRLGRRCSLEASPLRGLLQLDGGAPVDHLTRSPSDPRFKIPPTRRRSEMAVGELSAAAERVKANTAKTADLMTTTEWIGRGEPFAVGHL